MNHPAAYKLVFPEWYDERGEWEAEEKGWLQGVEIRYADGAVQPLFFYDPVRLAQDLEHEDADAMPFIASSGLIVIPRITRELMVRAVATLMEEGHFPLQAGVSAGANVIHHLRNASAIV